MGFSLRYWSLLSIIERCLIIKVPVMENQCVVLLHGLGRSPFAMWGLERYLSRQGYNVINLGYPSRRHGIAELCQTLMHDVIARVPGARAGAESPQVHFVTHSLGGILLRYGLQYWNAPNLRLGRAVMLAPPSQGSEVVDVLRYVPLLDKVMGPAFLELGTDQNSVPQRLMAMEGKAWPIEVGVIAGSSSYEPWFSPLFEGDNDGKVSVARSRHPAMSDFRVFQVGHTFIMNNKRVRHNISYFLQHGCFV